MAVPPVKPDGPLLSVSWACIALILLPMSGLTDAEQMLHGADVPRAVIKRVLTRSAERHLIIEPQVNIDSLLAPG